MTGRLLFLCIGVLTSICFADSVRELDFSDFNTLPELGYLQQISPYPANNFIICDVDGDGSEDVVNYTGKEVAYLSIRDFSNQVIEEIPLLHPVRGLSCADLDGDSASEVIYFTNEGFSGYLNIYNHRRQHKTRFLLAKGTDHFKNGSWDSRMMDAKLLRRSDGKNLLIVSLSTGRDYEPRGLYAVDLQQKKIVWKFLLGSRPIDQLLIEDINADQKPEILFSTFAPHNGIVKNGYPDSISYFFVLDENGRELWHQLYARGISYCHFQYSTATRQILIYGYSKEKDASSPALFISRAGEMAIVDSIKPAGVHLNWNIRPVNTRTSFAPLISFSKNETFYEVWEPTGSNQTSINLHRPVKHTYQLDLNGDRRREHLLFLGYPLSGESLCIILDSEFNLLGRREIPSNHFEQIITDSLRQDTRLFFRNTQKNQVFVWVLPWQQLVSPSVPGYYLLMYREKIYLVLTSLGGILVLGILFQLIRRQNREIRRANRIASFLINNPRDPILMLDKRGRVEIYSPAFRELFRVKERILPGFPASELFRNVDQLRLATLIEEALKEMAPDTIRKEQAEFLINGQPGRLQVDFRKISVSKDDSVLLVYFDDLTSLTRSERVASWAGLAQKMAHEMKNPLMTISLSLGRLEKKAHGAGGAIRKYTGFIRDEIYRMRKSLNTFMHFASSLHFRFEACQLNSLLSELAGFYRQHSPDRVEVRFTCADDLPAVRIDPEHTRTALSNLLDNAVEALGDAGLIEIDCCRVDTLADNGGTPTSWVEIKISDNGPGIPAEILSKIFQPNFTTKATGSGFGLSIAKHILEEQGGRLAVSSNQEAGTIVTIRLPAIAEEA